MGFRPLPTTLSMTDFAVAHLSERRAPFKTLYILKSFSIRKSGLSWGKQEEEEAKEEEHPSSNFITRFWTAKPNIKQKKMQIVGFLHVIN